MADVQGAGADIWRRTRLSAVKRKRSGIEWSIELFRASKLPEREHDSQFNWCGGGSVARKMEMNEDTEIWNLICSVEEGVSYHGERRDC